jgi:hypothetical protein
MDLTVIYSKTSKGSRLRSTLFGGLSSQLKKVLALVDGKSNVRQILARLDEVSEHKLTLDLTHLESEGYIKQVAQTVSEDWLRVSIFSPMVVEEFSHIEEIEAKAERDLQLEAEQKARAQMEDEIFAREVVEQIRAKEKSKADEKSRLEAERKKKQQIEEKARVAEKARIEKEQIDHEQEVLRKKNEAELLAKAEEVARIEKEELRKKMEIDALAKAEENSKLEIERKAKQHVENLQKAELRAREALDKIRAKEQALEQEFRKKSEEKALAKAEEESRLEAEYIARQEAEARLRLEIAAKEDAEISRKKAEIEEIKRIETERNIFEAEKMLKQAETEARAKIEEEARLEERRIAKERLAAETKLKAKIKSKIKADEKARKEAELIAKREEKAALAIQEKIRKEANRQVLAEAQRLVAEVEYEKSEVNTHAKITARKIPRRKLIPVVIKTMLVYIPLVVLLLVGLLHFINLSILASPIQKLASESIVEQVVVQEVHVSLWPEPHLTLEGVTVGASSDMKNKPLKIDSVYIIPAIATLFDKVKLVELIKFSGIDLQQDLAKKVLQSVDNLRKSEYLKVKRISFNQVNIKILDLNLEPLEGEIALNESQGLISITMNNLDNTLSIQFSPHGDDFNFSITALRWALPFNPKIVFEEIKAKGKFNSDQINISQLDGNIYGGNLHANAILSWSKQWVVEGNFSLAQASILQLLKANASDSNIEGILNLTGNFKGTSNIASKLASESEVNSNFEINNGKIFGIDLERAVLARNDKSLSGDATSFKKLIGVLKFKSGSIEYKKLLLQAPQLQAQGNLDIQSNQDISGNISASLEAQSRRLESRFELIGKVYNVKQR